MARPRTRPAYKRRSWLPGFTLVELLIGLAILSIMSVLMFSALRLGAKTWESVDRASMRTADLRLPANFIANALAQSRASSRVVDGQRVGLFSGREDAIEFVAPISDQVGIPGLYVIRLTTEAMADGTGLIMTRWLLHPEVLEGEGEHPAWRPLQADGFNDAGEGELDQDIAGGVYGRTLLASDVDLFELSYFGRQDRTQEPQWSDVWLNQYEPPMAVLVRLGAQGKRWPDILMQLPSGALNPASRPSIFR